MNKIDKKNLMFIWYVLVSLAVAALVILQYFNLEEFNQIRTYNSSEFLVTETEKIIAENDADREQLHSLLKEIYLEKAKSASYVIDSRPDMQTNTKKLRTFAHELGVDQIHLFDETGTIYSSTDIDYIGLNMEDGEQISEFLPMLQDKGLTMSQGLSPNTKEGRLMLYSACWNYDGSHIVQVGAYGERFPRMLNRNRIDMFLDLIPDNPACSILLTDLGSDQIVASSDESLKGKTLSQLGINLPEDSEKAVVSFKTGVPENPIYCTTKAYREFQIVIAQYKNLVDREIPIALFTFAEYLILVFIAMTFVVNHYYDKYMLVQAYVMRDKLTDLYSRRAYEIALSDLENQTLNEDLVFVSMDVNGLKGVNDNLGHQAGDELLKSAARCMLQCFGPVGKIYRFGGDEFAALIYVKELEIPPLLDQLHSLCLDWSRETGIDLSISVGCALSCKNPKANIHDLEALADQNMYADKNRFYSMNSHNRRGTAHESK